MVLISCTWNQVTVIVNRADNLSPISKGEKSYTFPVCVSYVIFLQMKALWRWRE